MAADHSRRNASSFRRIPIPGVGGRGGSGGDARHRLSPPSLPLFSAPSSLSDHTVTNSSTLSSGSGGSSSARSGGHARGAAPDAAASASGRHAQGGKAAGSNSMASSPSSRRRQYAQDLQHKALSRKALMENDAMVYLDGPQVYTCGNCRTHLTSHDDIISKSFHGRHGEYCASRGVFSSFFGSESFAWVRSGLTLFCRVKSLDDGCAFCMGSF